MLLSEKIAVVTGAGRGIGKGIALALAREGAFVIVNYNGSKDSAEKVVEEIETNAGITRDNLLLKMSEEEFSDVIQTNLTGTFHGVKFASRAMLRKRYGRIINISSVSGVMGNAGQANYSASKAGVIGLTKTAARELASRNITVNAIAPGFIKTDMTDKLPDSVKEEAVKTIPLGDFGNVEDIAETVVFLASDKARYITGQVLNVDGGVCM